VIIYMTEVAPGVIAFSKIIEVDARHVSNVTGLIDANSEEITMCVTGWKRRNCDQCALASIPCDPSECNNDKVFDVDRAEKRTVAPNIRCLDVGVSQDVMERKLDFSNRTYGSDDSVRGLAL